ncbi:chaperone protein dnaJ 20, chloroplastic-like [Apium graveolens]|uniref:chaperone protein dnaJ 20, chloroplastic-like n=1 Tax=Apium graveolens TaxID=4045 RepID=UPI003D79DD81
MNSPVISFQESSPIHTYNLSPSFNPSPKRSNLEPSGFISLDTHLKTPSFSVKKSSASRKSRTMAAMTSNMYAPPQETESFYQLLGISESGTLSEIKKAYKQLARKYHPDVSPAERVDEYTQRFILVQQAYETLSDPQTKALYDRDLSTGFHYNFSARGRGSAYEQQGSEWKNIWESQLTKLKNKSMYNGDGSRQSWGARMRSQNRE